MDKKRILEILEGAKDDNGEIPMSLVRKAFEKIEEPCADAVSRQAAIDAIKTSRYLVDAMEKIIRLPSAQPERKKGTWINDKCSVCGYGVQPWNNTPFCPKCGAYMKGEQ